MSQETAQTQNSPGQNSNSEENRRAATEAINNTQQTHWLTRIGQGLTRSEVSFTLALIALVVSIYVSVQYLQDISRVSILIPFWQPDETVIAQSQEILRSVTEQINQYLTFLQTATAVLGIVGAAFVVVGLRSLGQVNELREEVTTKLIQVDADLKELETSKKSLSEAGTSLRAKQQEIIELQQKQKAEVQEAIEAGTQLQFAVEQVDLGNYRVAEKIFSDINQRIPEDPVVNYFLGDVLLRQGQLDKGIEYLEKAQQAKHMWAAQATYAYALRQKADKTSYEPTKARLYQKVDAIFDGILEAAPQLLDTQRESAFGAWASLKKRQKNIEEAIHLYLHCNSITPHSSYPLINLGQLHLQYDGNEYGMIQCNATRGLKYFEEAHAKALHQSGRNPTDQWHIFDVILSKTVIGKPWEEIEPFWIQVQEAPVMNPGDIQKLYDSFNSLKDVKNEVVRERIRAVQAKILPFGDSTVSPDFQS